MNKRPTFVIKFIALLLVFSLFHSGFELNALESSYETILTSLIKRFKQGKFKEIIPELEKLLNEVGEENSQIRGQFFILLGASYEKNKIKDSAIENYLLGDMLLDEPVVEGIDLREMEIYKSTFFGKIIRGRRVYEKVGKRKRKRKFPYLAILGVAAITIAVIFLMKKKTKEDIENIDEIYATDVFNSIEWVEIPAGEFQMGDNHGMGAADELPVHKVYLDSYKISKYEITYAQFQKYSYMNPDIHTYYEGEGDDYPVTMVRRHEIDSFCKWISDLTRNNVLLPTEAQWEKAARGADQRIYPWGNYSPDCNITNYNNCLGNTSLVGSHPEDRSYYGVMDMGGNVSEHVYDAYQEDYYSVSPYSNPLNYEKEHTDHRVIRGGNWISNDLRASRRESFRPMSFRNYIGFRIVWID